MYKSFIILTLLSVVFVGCVSSNKIYNPPKDIIKIENSVNVNQPKEVVWTKLIQGVASNFFVINNMDKQSGFINISYSGDPEKYVDGGDFTFTFENLRGKRTYNFPGARANSQYETMINGNLCTIIRQLDLDGRMNIIVNSIDSAKTKVTVNTKYILTLKNSGTTVTGQTLIPSQEVISFNTGQSAQTSAGTKFFANGE
ncbi:MAG: hypothetical protein ACM3RX_06045, partial [Methanococcaceae archaeon]